MGRQKSLRAVRYRAVAIADMAVAMYSQGAKIVNRLVGLLSHDQTSRPSTMDGPMRTPISAIRPEMPAVRPLQKDEERQCEKPAGNDEDTGEAHRILRDLATDAEVIVPPEHCKAD